MGKGTTCCSFARGERPPMMRKIFLLMATNLALCSTAASAAEYTLVVQPVLPAKKTLSHYAPLAKYLSNKTGQKIRLVAATNFITYWETMKKGKEYDIILDAAHFTDFRVKKQKFLVIAKVPDKVSYSLVTSEEELILEPAELVGKKVAHMPSPSLGAIRLEELFPNMVRQPVSLEAADSTEAINAVLKGKAKAAIVPTPIAGQYNNLNTVMTTQQVPHMAFSVSPRVPRDLAQKLQKILIEASKDPEGQKMLQQINFAGFVNTNSKAYAGHARLLKGVWGYKD